VTERGSSATHNRSKAKVSKLPSVFKTVTLATYNSKIPKHTKKLSQRSQTESETVNYSNEANSEGFTNYANEANVADSNFTSYSAGATGGSG
jgi:hypothetical protein